MMGVMLYCKKTGRNMNMGYGGFNRLRNKVAELAGEPFASHYAKLSRPEYMFCVTPDVTQKLYAEFDAETQRIISEGKVSFKIVDFCLQSDCEGKIRYGVCKEILKAIGDYDDDHTYYGYAHYGPHGITGSGTLSDFKAILQDCVDNKCMLIWG